MRRVEEVNAPRIDEVAQAIIGEVDPSKMPDGHRVDFLPLQSTSAPGAVAAVDGGHSVVADLGTLGIVAVRAGYTVTETGARFEDRIARDIVHTVTKRRAQQQWVQLLQPYDWGSNLEAPSTAGQNWIRAWTEAERGLAEFDAARRALRGLAPGSLLLMDGSLDSDNPHAGLVESLLDVARRVGVTVVGVTKDTSLSLGGLLPFTLELEEIAQGREAPGRFSADVTAALGRHGPFTTFGVRWDPTTPVYRVDVAPPPGRNAREAVGQLLKFCNDAAYPGYPYPLARIHQRVHYRGGESADLRLRLEAFVSERRGSQFGRRLFGRGRDVLALAS